MSVVLYERKKKNVLLVKILLFGERTNSSTRYYLTLHLTLVHHDKSRTRLKKNPVTVGNGTVSFTFSFAKERCKLAYEPVLNVKITRHLDLWCVW